MKIQALHLHHLLDYARLRGIPEPEQLKQIVPSPGTKPLEEATIEAADFYALVKLVRVTLQDDLFGIRFGEFMNLKLLGLIYQISLQTTTVEEALYYLNNYLNASLPLVQMETNFSSGSVTIQLSINNEKEAENRIILENVLTIISRELHIMAGPDLHIQLSSPYYTSAYPINWRMEKTFTITFTKTILKASLQNKSRWQLDVLVPEYLKLIENLKAEQSFSTKVKIIMLSMARPELPGLPHVANTFNMTARTLQRRLGIENTTFRQINELLKKDISYLLINHKQYSIADISEVLGFSEPSSFIHSFKKWYGHSPEQYRQQLTLSIMNNSLASSN